MMSELLPGLTLMVLLGLIKGRSTGTRLLAVSWLSRKICVMIWPLAAGTAPADTVPLCSLASASGTTKYSPEESTSAKPCVRSWVENCLNAWVGVTGEVVTKVIVPLTRGSTTTLRPVMTAMVRATASISAFKKFRVTVLFERAALLLCVALLLGAFVMSWSFKAPQWLYITANTAIKLIAIWPVDLEAPGKCARAEKVCGRVSMCFSPK